MLHQFYKPMSPILSNSIPQGSNFIYQIKWDGIRGIIYIHPCKFKIYTKNGTDVTEKYPELHGLKKYFKGETAILDGELVVFDDNNKPSFEKILSRQMVKSKIKIDYYAGNLPINYLVFDILYFNGQDLRRFDYVDRKEVLEKNFINHNRSAVVEDFFDGPSLFKLMQEKEMEGIVAKKLDSPYTSGKQHKDWYKIKIKRKMLVVVGGIKLKNKMPVSLAIGIYQNNELYYVGHVSSGLKHKDLELLHQHLNIMKSTSSPFINYTHDSNTEWVKPLLTCYVSYLEKGTHHHLRHPQIIGFSNEPPLKADGKEFIIEHDNPSI